MLALVASCASHPIASPGSEATGDLLRRLVRTHHVCGAAVAVIRQGRVETVETASGCEPGWQVDSHSLFQAASLGKPVFAYAVLKLVQQGRMDLDRPVSDYLPTGYQRPLDPLSQHDDAPAERLPASQLQAVTVRMLLQHTSGLPNWARGPLRLEEKPGTRWRYSGEGYLLLQQAFESVTGQPLDEGMRSLVFAPLGMQQSSYRWNPQVAAHLVAGTKGNGSPRKTVVFHQPRAAYTLYTSVLDYARFLVAVLDDESTMDLIAESPVTVDSARGLSWGLGWGLEQASDGVRLWQRGNNPGYRAFTLVAPGSGKGLVILTNSDAGMKLVEPWVTGSISGPDPVLSSPFVSATVTDLLCDALRICL